MKILQFQGQAFSSLHRKNNATPALQLWFLLPTKLFTMFSLTVDYDKLENGLKVTASRAASAASKRAEEVRLAQNDIAALLAQKRVEKAKMLAENSILQEYYHEIFNLVEVMCLTLLEHIDEFRNDEDIRTKVRVEQAVHSLIWATPRMIHELPSLKIVAEQMLLRFGKQYFDVCLSNKSNKVNEIMVCRLAPSTFKSTTLIRYLAEIARIRNIPFDPDKSLLKDDEKEFSDSFLLDFTKLQSEKEFRLYIPLWSLVRMPEDGIELSKKERIRRDFAEKHLFPLMRKSAVDKEFFKQASMLFYELLVKQEPLLNEEYNKNPADILHVICTTILHYTDSFVFNPNYGAFDDTPRIQRRPDKRIRIVETQEHRILLKHFRNMLRRR
ncbi:IST1 -like protein [Trichinella spiralis]|uniref:IST1 homolog n=1 Tax=Trichinella spiralis TaxID=6334 RepID=A0A0V1B9E1_TRISP|nr:IST1 -like protein [Trichinella spiralis]